MRRPARTRARPWRVAAAGLRACFRSSAVSRVSPTRADDSPAWYGATDRAGYVQRSPEGAAGSGETERSEGRTGPRSVTFVCGCLGLGLGQHDEAALVDADRAAAHALPVDHRAVRTGSQRVADEIE